METTQLRRLAFVLALVTFGSFFQRTIYAQTTADSAENATDSQAHNHFLSLNATKTYIAYKIPSQFSPPTIDGVFNEPIWDFADEDSLLGGGVPNAFGTTWPSSNFTDNLVIWKAVWSNVTNKLYVAVTVQDDVRGTYDNTDPNGEPFDDDAIQFLTDGNNNGGLYEGSFPSEAQQLWVSAQNRKILDDFPSSTNRQEYTGNEFMSAVRLGSGGNWTCEVEFEIYNIFPTNRKTLNEGNIIGWNIWYDDSDDQSPDNNGVFRRDHQVGWVYDGAAFRNADFFGDMIFMGEPPPPNPPGNVVATAISSNRVDLNWDDNSNETQFRIERRLGTSGSFGFLANVAADTTNYRDTGRSPNTTYQYRVRAENSVGNSAYTTSNPVTTDDVSPDSPSNLVATAISSNQVDLNWNDNSDNETGFRIEQSINGGGYSFLANVGANDTSFSDTNVNQGTTYQYRTRAENSVGNSSFAVSNQIMISGDQTPPQIAFSPISSGASGQSSTISTVLTDNIGIQSATLFYRRGGASSYSSTSMTNTSGDTWQGTIPASFITERGVEYYFTAQDAGGNTATFPTNNPQSNPQVIQVTSSDLSFSSPNLAYRMISVPIDLDNPSPSSVLEANLGPYDDTQWRLLKYISGTNQEFTKASIGNFDPGRGFWLITRGSKPLLTGSGKSVTTEQNYVITLPPGWSQIGNPFAFTVNWDDVIKNGNVDDVLVGYQGSANDATGYDFTRTQLQPFQGYFVNNQEAINITIEIPPQSATGTTVLAKQAGLPVLSTLQNNEWAIQLTAQSDRYLDKDNYIGVLDDASDTWDSNDFSEAPFFDSFVLLYFPHEDWEVYPGLYTGDFRSINTEGHFWDFHVKSNIANSEVVLNLANIQNLPSEMDIVLIDKASRISISLLEQDSYTFASGADGAERDFRIVMGKSDFVDSNDLDFSGIPETFTLLQNYPNPFNPETNIDYELPLESEVKIAIYNLRGQRVRTLLDAQQNPGRYTVSWDGKSDNGLSVASGVYLVRMQAGKFVSVRKVLLTK